MSGVWVVVNCAHDVCGGDSSVTFIGAFSTEEKAIAVAEGFGGCEMQYVEIDAVTES